MNFLHIVLCALTANYESAVAFEQALNLEAYTASSSSSSSSSSYFGAYLLPSQSLFPSDTTVPLTAIAENAKLTVSGTEGETTWYYFDLDRFEGNEMPLIQVQLSGGTGNAEIYVTYKELPTSWNPNAQNVAGCTTADEDNDNEEICHILYEVGRFYIMVYGVSDFSNAELQWSLVSVPWTARRLCEERLYTVTSVLRDETEFYYYLEPWKVPYLSGMDILAWNDGHRLSVFDPEPKCEIENFEAALTGAVSRCSYNSSSVETGELSAGYYYVQVYPRGLIVNVERSYNVNVLLRLYYAISWRLYWKVTVVNQVVDIYSKIVLARLEFLWYPYSCIGPRCWFFTNCIQYSIDTPPVLPLAGTRRRRTARRRRTRRRNLLWGSGGGSNWGNDNDGGSKWSGGSNWGNDGGSNWGNDGGSKWSNNWSNNNNNWNKPSWPTPPPSWKKPCPSPPPTLRPPSLPPVPPPITTTTTTTTTPPPIPPIIVPPPTPPPQAPQELCIYYVWMWDDDEKEWTRYTQLPAAVQHLSLEELAMEDEFNRNWGTIEIFTVVNAQGVDEHIKYNQCVTHCTATKDGYLIYVYSNHESGWWLKYNTISNLYERNSYPAPFSNEPDIDLAPLQIKNIQNPCVVQDDEQTIYVIGGKGSKASSSSDAATTYVQVWNWSIRSWNVALRHPVDYLTSMTCAYRNGKIYTFGGLIDRNDGITPTQAYSGVHVYDTRSGQWIQDKLTDLQFANWGMRHMVDDIDGYIYLIGGYAYSETSIVSSTNTLVESLDYDIELDVAFPPTVIDTSLAYNKSLVQVFDYKTNITKYERSFFYEGAVMVNELSSRGVQGWFYGFWRVYRYLMVRVVTTYLRYRKIVWSANLTMIANSSNITECPTPFPTRSPTPPLPTTTTPAPTTTTTTTTTTTKPPTRTTTTTTTTMPPVWDTSGKGSKAQSVQSVVNNDVAEVNSNEGAVSKYRHGYGSQGGAAVIHRASPQNEVGKDVVGLSANLRNWMIYGAIFGILLFIVLIKLVCDNREYRLQLRKHEYIYGKSAGNQPNPENDDEDDQTEEEEMNEEDVDAHDDNHDDDHQQNMYA